MAASAWHSSARSSAYGTFDSDEHHALGELTPGERICPPTARRGRRAVLRALFLIMIALGGGWAYYGDQLTLPELPPAVAAALSSLMERRGPPPIAPAPTQTLPTVETAPDPKSAALDTQPSPPAPPNPTTAAPRDVPRPAEPPLTTAALPSSATNAEETSSEPLPPPSIDPSDPYQARALAVGLHPGLSRVLLARLSQTDYRNAAIAIQKAIAETPDTGVFVWPRQRKPELALFHVHFVRGAAPDCRRYVVTVAKDGWSTTALPMEKCAPHPGAPRRG